MKTQALNTVVAVAMAIASPGLADGVIEVEVNHPVTAAQYLAVPAGPLVVAAMLGNGFAGDVDYFTFFGQAGDVVTVDIDGAFVEPQRLDTVLAIFGPAPAYGMLRFNDDASPVDPGSSSAADARIDNFVLPQSGRYTVGVSNYPRYFMDGGGVRSGMAKEGSYTLTISGVTPEILHVAIDIKPGNHEAFAPLNPKSRGKIPVAILSGPQFDPAMLDIGSLTFGSTGKEPSIAKCHWSGEDLNNDGTVDLVCHFENRLAGFKPGDTEGILRGRTHDDRQIEGRGFLKIVPQKPS